ncbi:MAG: hypothetical protein OEW96_08520 [Betaproteobacteria bacterium]|nr:hypothetical protein [Betaproteobacteria bacterium]MDH5211698.1 hypothetical protein [Betaproteobacteria bacterium]
MRSVLATLARRRAALVERSGLQRAELVAGATGVRRALAEPLALGLAAGLALAGGAPRLRAWLVRGWVAYALVRRLLR